MNATNKFLTILLSFLVLTLAGTSFASAQSIRSGIKGGINVSNLYINDVSDENSRIGFNVGIYGQLFPSDVFTIQPELLYTTKGTKAVYDGVFVGSTDFNLNYIELPVLGVIKLGKVMELHLGPYFGYLVNANIKYDGDFGSGNNELDRDNFTKLDYGIAAGLGSKFWRCCKLEHVMITDS